MIKRTIPAVILATTVASLISAPAFAGSIFQTGNLVVSVEGCGIETGLPGAGCAGVPNGTGTGAQNSTLGGYGDNQAAPLTLFQFTTTGSYEGSLVLPQCGTGVTLCGNGNLTVSGEYGSSSEAQLQLSGNGQFLTIMGYGVNYNSFNAAAGMPGSYSVTGDARLAQSGSLSPANQTAGSTYTPVARVAALIDSNGNVNSTTGLYNVFDNNNPRSAYTANGTTVYVSGQGNSPDNTGGVFYSAIGGVNNTPTPITGNDTTSKTLTQDTRDVQIYNNTLYVSVDSTEGSGSNRSFVGTLGSPPSTGLYNSNSGPTQLSSSNNASTPVAVTSTGKLVLTAGETNGINGAGQTINLSPEDYWFANSTTMYVADDGTPKQTSASTTLGDGGLQKWSLVSGVWQLDYTLSVGLDLVENNASDSADTDGATGLDGLTGELIDGGTEVELFATNYTIADLDQTYLYGIVDVLADTTNPGNESFTELAAAPADSNFKGVSFAPTDTPEPSTSILFGLGIAGLVAARRRKAA